MGIWPSWKDSFGAGNMATGFPAGSDVHSDQNVNQSDAMNCDPPANHTFVTSNCAAEIEREGLDRMDTAAPCEGYVGLLSPNLTRFGGVSPNTLSDFLVHHQSFLAESGQKTLQAYPTFTAIDIVRYQEEGLAKTTEAASQNLAKCDAIHRSQMAEMSNTYQQQLTEIEARSEGKVQALSSSKNLVLKQLTDADDKVVRLTAAETKANDRNRTLNQTNDKLSKEKEQRETSLEKRDIDLKAANVRMNYLEDELSCSTSAGQAKEQEVQRLKSDILVKDKDYQGLLSINTQLVSECQKLKDKITGIEKKSAQESTTSGSYAEGHANPAQLVSACQTVDMATDKLARFAHDISIRRNLPLKSAEMERFIHAMSRASVGDFTRPAHVKQIWAHWICSKMYQGFENVFFDVGDERTSPVDSKNYATECFQSFQKMQGKSSTGLHEDCKYFQEYCSKMYSLVFPPSVVNEGFDWSDSGTFDKNGRYDGDVDLYALFLDVSKAIWLLHELAFSFDPPASILRTGWGEPFDRQLHDSLIKEADIDMMSSKVVLMARPAFRIKNIMASKSRVFLSKKS